MKMTQYVQHGDELVISMLSIRFYHRSEAGSVNRMWARSRVNMSIFGS